MKNKKRYYSNIQKSEQGFTLLEVLIVIVVFSVGLLALSAMQFSAATGNSGAYKLTEATHIASSQLEALLSADYSDPLLSTGAHPITTNNGYSLSYTVTEPVTDKVKKISLTITRTDVVSRSNTYNLFVTNIQ